jgi:hypothetical protein
MLLMGRIADCCTDIHDVFTILPVGSTALFIVFSVDLSFLSHNKENYGLYIHTYIVVTFIIDLS